MLRWTSPSANRSAAGTSSLPLYLSLLLPLPPLFPHPSLPGILAWMVVSIPLLPSRQLQAFSSLPPNGTQGLISISSPTLRSDWASFAALNSGSIFDVSIYLLDQNPAPRRISSLVEIALNASASVDACAVCGGNGLSCAGCDGLPNRFEIYFTHYSDFIAF
jgi:hypothetical protein